jgi:hypothetical protein
MARGEAIALGLMAFFSTTLDILAVVLIFFGREYVKTFTLMDRETYFAFIYISIGQLLGMFVSKYMSIYIHMYQYIYEYIHMDIYM